MSTALAPTVHRKGGPKLSEDERRAIVASVASGKRQVDVAREFNVHPNTVYSLWNSVKKGSKLGASTLQAWREKLDTGSFEAIEASVGDAKNDPHKAANTGLAWLKGVGVLQGDSQVNVTVQTMLASIPEEWRNEMIVTPDTTTGSEVMPDNGATAVE